MLKIIPYIYRQACCDPNLMLPVLMAGSWVGFPTICARLKKDPGIQLKQQNFLNLTITLGSCNICEKKLFILGI